MEPWPVRMKRLRAATGLSQAKVARHFGIAPVSVAQWETGRSKPMLDRIPALASLYRVSIAELCGSDIPIPVLSFSSERSSDTASNVENRVAVRQDSPTRSETIDDLDELALLDFWRDLSITKKAALFGYLGADEMPSLRKII